jgi:hypothetical protein
MAVTVVPRDTIGERLGTGLGAGIGAGLQSLAQHKINQFQQRQQQAQSYNQLRQLPGVSDEVAQFISSYDPDTQLKLIQTFGQAGLFNQPEQMFEPGPETGLQAIQEPVRAQQPLNTQQLLQSLSAPGTFPFQQQQAPQPTREEPSRVQPVRTKASQPEIAGPRPKTITEALAQGYKTPQMLQQERLAQQKLEAQERRSQFKETKAERKEIVDRAKAARQNLHDLDRMEELQKEGKLDTPGYIEGLKRAGFDIPALMNPGSEEFQKIAANFLKDAKTYFGARVSNYEIEQFLKTIPSLSQSPEGRKRVIANLKNLSRGALEYNNALREVMAENKGVPPYDLLELVDAKVEKKEDALAKKFKKDLAKPVPEGQNKYVTAIQAAIGNVAGRIPGALKGAVIGAGYGALHGSKGGPVGTLGGAALGGLAGLTGII